MPDGVFVTMELAGASRALGTVTFSARDANVYVRPMRRDPGSTFDYGFVEHPAGVAAFTYSTSGQLHASERPHISIHESGNCHVRAGRDRHAPIDGATIGPLNSYVGAHVTSIFTSDVADLVLRDDVWPEQGSLDAGAEEWRVPLPSRRPAEGRVALEGSCRRCHRSGLCGEGFSRTERAAGPLPQQGNATRPTTRPSTPSRVYNHS